MLRRLTLAVCFIPALGGVASADSFGLASQVTDLKVVTISKLPKGNAKTQEDDRWQCAMTAEDITSVAGNLVLAQNWRVTSEVERVGLTFVSFVESAEPGTSGSCSQTDGNVGIFRGETLLGLIYSDKGAMKSIGSIQALEGDRIRIWDGGYLQQPLADLQIVERDLVIVRNVAERDSFCEGASSAPNIFNLPINLARQQLLAEGWSPNPVPPEDADQFYAEERKLLPELDTW